jgi:hypothetical protein
VVELSAVRSKAMDKTLYIMLSELEPPAEYLAGDYSSLWTLHDMDDGVRKKLFEELNILIEMFKQRLL